MKDANGKDAEGLAYVSQKLGAQSVIASLWPVDDVGTQVLMPLFYRLRTTGLTKAEAFQRAQLALLHGDVKEVPGVTRSSQLSAVVRGVGEPQYSRSAKAFRPPVLLGAVCPNRQLEITKLVQRRIARQMAHENHLKKGTRLERALVPLDAAADKSAV